MLYLTEGRQTERIDKLVNFKYKADIDLVLYWHYLTIKDQLIKDIQTEVEYYGVRV